MLDEKLKKARREYYKKWRAANKDKVAQHNKNFWAKKAAALAASEQSGENNDDRQD